MNAQLKSETRDPIFQSAWGRRIWAVPVVAFAVLSAFHLSWIAIHAVDIPFQDEWDLLLDSGIASDFSLSWLHGQHNEHRMAASRLEAWLLYRIDDWNLAHAQVINFCVFLLLPLSLLSLMKRARPGLPPGVLCLFLLFVVSPVNYWNHTMGFQIGFHLWLLFLILPARFLFAARQRPWQLALGTGFAILGFWTISAGLVSAVALLAVFVLFKLQRIRESDHSSRRVEAWQLVSVCTAILAMLPVWLWGYQAPPHHPDLVFPISLEFWRFFLNLIAFGFGVEVQSSLLGAVGALVLLVPVVAVLIRSKGRPAPAEWAVYAVLFALLSSLAVVAVGRAGFGLGATRAERYVELVMLLGPLSAMVWAIALPRGWPMLAALATLWLAIAGFHSNSWDFRSYTREAESRRALIGCIERELAENGDGDCPTLYPRPLAWRLENARRFEISLIRTLREKHGWTE